jgi:hypothetical protein
MYNKRSFKSETSRKIDTRYLVVKSDVETEDLLEFDIQDIFMNYITSVYVPKSEMHSYFLTDEQKNDLMEILDSMGRADEVLNHLENLDCYGKISNIDQLEEIMIDRYFPESEANLRKLNNGLYELFD